MRLKEIRALVEGTGDPAFAVDGSGLIVAWNSAAGALFGVCEKRFVTPFSGQDKKAIDREH